MDFPPKLSPAYTVPPLEERLLPEQAAEIIGVKVGTLKNWRSKKKGPAYYDIGRVFYTRKDIEQWMRTRRTDPNRW